MCVPCISIAQWGHRLCNASLSSSSPPPPSPHPKHNRMCINIYMSCVDTQYINQRNDAQQTKKKHCQRPTTATVPHTHNTWTWHNWLYLHIINLMKSIDPNIEKSILLFETIFLLLLIDSFKSFDVRHVYDHNHVHSLKSNEFVICNMYFRLLKGL